MSLSSLPDIFRRSSTLSIRVQKQGGPFSLNLNNYSTERNQTSRAGYAPGENNNQNFHSTKSRSISMQSVRVKPSILRDQNFKKGGDSKNKLKVIFKEDFDLFNEGPVKQRIGMSVLNTSNFPYETSRRLNNCVQQLQEAESLKNKLESHIQEMDIMRNLLDRCKGQNNATKQQLVNMKVSINKQLLQFEAMFRAAMSESYSKLSILRRQTNNQLKINRQNIQKVKSQLTVCDSFSVDLTTKIDNMYAQCLKISQSEQRSSGSGQLYDFQQISSVRKSSRGATGDVSKRTRLVEMLKQVESNRKSADLRYQMDSKEIFTFNGREVDMLNIQDEY